MTPLIRDACFWSQLYEMTAFLRTLYLFTSDDIRGIVATNAICGVVVPLTGSLVQPQISTRLTAMRAPLVVLWVWTNLLLFNVSNQRRPEAIQEDGKNKPWRPLPAGRLNADQANRLLIILRPAAALLSYVLGAIIPCLALQTLTFIYNELGAGDTWKFRNVVNAAGFLSFATGAVQVAIGSRPHSYCSGILGWMLLLGAAIASTIHVQDLYDMRGDLVRGRRTIPIVFGDSAARFSIALQILIWSMIGPTFWSLPFAGFLPSIILGLVVAQRVLWNKRHRDPTIDKNTFKIWSLWVTTLYLLPVLSRSSRALVM